MKTKMVRYTRETIPRMTDERAAQLKARFEDPNFKIDYSDIPEMTEERYQAAKLAGQIFVGRWYRPVKKQVSARLDADVLHWLKKEGRGYQSRMNAILRSEMLASLRAAAPKPAAKSESVPRRRKAVASGK